jgi:hypothetical protein
MIIIYVCTGIAILSILFLIGWFFNAIDIAQEEIDNDND